MLHICFLLHPLAPMHMRSFALLLAFGALPAIAQAPYADALRDEAAPIILDAALTDFVGLRDRPVPDTAPDTVWTGTYSRLPDAGLIVASTGTAAGENPSAYYDLQMRVSDASDRASLQQRLIIAANAVGPLLGEAGWGQEFGGNIDSLAEPAFAGWEECPREGRGRYALFAYLPRADGTADLRLRFGRYLAPSCTSSPVRFTAE